MAFDAQRECVSMSAREQVQALLKIITDAANEALNEYEKHGADTPLLDSILPHP